LLLALLAACGCRHSASPAATHPALSAATQPAACTVTSPDFPALWQAIELSIRARSYRVDRADARNGVITTEPMISQQWFEPWRRDTVGFDSVTESSLATIRRTVRFDISRTSCGQYAAVARVSVERQATPQRQLTAPALYRSALAPDRRALAFLSSSDPDVFRPYWYSLGDDPGLARALANDVARRLAP
jgi:hypothetical protein